MTVLRAATLGRAGLICGLVANVCTLSCSCLHAVLLILLRNSIDLP
jgi:hypothetical protein